MNYKVMLLVAGLALGVSFIGTQIFSGNVGREGQSAAVASVLEQGVLRAGYIVYPPYIMKDPNSGELSGIFYDLTNALADQFDLDVEWIEAGGYGTIFSDLDSARYDVFAGGLWANSTRAKAGYLTGPAFYSAIYAYARNSDHRFDNNLTAINNPSVTISSLDGGIDNAIANADYPKARDITLPQTAASSQSQLNVASGKADITFAAADVIALFLKENPGTLRKVSPQPVRIYGNSYAVKRGAVDLYQMFDTAIQEAVNNGTVDKILKAYESSSDTYLRLAAPYAN